MNFGATLSSQCILRRGVPTDEITIDVSDGDDDSASDGADSEEDGLFSYAASGKAKGEKR